MKKIITILFFSFISINIYAQGEANNWFFGRYCAITFNTPDKSPVFLSGSQMDTDEGCASISDRNGKLLFYTNGMTIWNADNVQMPHGDNLWGHNSSTQSAVIVKKPASDNIYYVFTVDRQGGTHGLGYTIVDMKKDAGRGDVISKNNYLHYPVVEKITAIRSYDDKGIWIIAHEWGSNKFLAYLLTDSGINDIPVISAVGSVYGGDNMNAGGYMKASPDGKYIASAVYWDGIFEILNFDNRTGRVSHPITFKSFNSEYKYIYGVEFSPDGSKVYFSKAREPARIYQVDLRAGDDTDIKNSITIIAESQSYYVYQALQIAPDKKIYIAKRNKTYLSVIAAPNEKGSACNFKEHAFDLNMRKCFAGLPTFNQSFFDLYVHIQGDTNLCEGETLRLDCQNYDNAVYSWTTPGGEQSDTSFIEIPNISLNDSGIYIVTVQVEDIKKSDTVFVTVYKRPLTTIAPKDTAYICGSESVVLTSTTAGNNLEYFWSTGDTTKSIEVFNPGIYFLIVTNENGCSDTAYVNVLRRSVLDVKIIKFGFDKLCEGSSITLETEKSYASYLWSTGSTDSSIIVNTPGKYFVTVMDKNGCRGSDSIIIERYDMQLTKLKDVDFGMVLTGSREKLEIDFVNSGEDSVYISSISQLINIPEYKVTWSPSIPVWLKQDEKIIITVEFSPKANGVFLDSLQVIAAFPCNEIQQIAITGYSGWVNSQIWIPDTTADIGKVNYSIPIYAKLLEDDTLNLSYTADISFDAEIFMPDDNQPDIIESKIENGKRKLHIVGHNVEISDKQIVLTEIKGTVLLSSGKHILFIDDFKWNTPYVLFDTTNGSLTATGVCRPELSKIILSMTKSVTIFPNPADNMITIASDDAASDFKIYYIKIFNYQGQLIEKEEHPEKINENSYRLNTSNLIIGSYFFVVNSNFGVFNFPVVIYR